MARPGGTRGGGSPALPRPAHRGTAAAPPGPAAPPVSQAGRWPGLQRLSASRSAPKRREPRLPIGAAPGNFDGGHPGRCPPARATAQAHLVQSWAETFALSRASLCSEGRGRSPTALAEHCAFRDPPQLCELKKRVGDRCETTWLAPLSLGP